MFHANNSGEFFFTQQLGYANVVETSRAWFFASWAIAVLDVAYLIPYSIGVLDQFWSIADLPFVEVISKELARLAINKFGEKMPVSE